MKKILIINGSLGDQKGNTQIVLDKMSLHLEHTTQLEFLHLQDFFLNHTHQESISILSQKLNWADGFIFSTGTYWDSWGSPLQTFLEITTSFEASNLFFGKPAAVIVTMHSVGGKGVLSRLQGVLNTMGILIPPMSGMVYSLAGKLAIEKESSWSDDFWSLNDLEIITHNLVTSLQIKQNFKAWPVDHDDPKRIWIK